MAALRMYSLVAVTLLLLSEPALARELLQTPTCNPFSDHPNQCFNSNGSQSTCCTGGCSAAPGAVATCDDGTLGTAAIVGGNSGATASPTSSPTSAASGNYTGFPEFAPGTNQSPLDLSGNADPYHTTFSFAVIGDSGRTGGKASEGAAQCSATSFTDDDVTNGIWQLNTAKLLADECNNVKCSMVLNCGDNFYECGVYPGDNSRLTGDYWNVYRPYVSLQNLVWYSTLGNHDMVINGSMEQQMSFNDPQWYLPAANFVRDFAYSGVTLRAIFFDMNPFIANYNSPTQKYHKNWFIGHSNQQYGDAVVAYIANALATSTATYDILIAHYPLFGSNVDYGIASNGLYNVFPRIVSLINQYKPVAFFNGHDHTLTLGNAGNNSNPYTSYVTSGAGGTHGYSDACGATTDFYSNGGQGGFVIVQATASKFTVKYYTTSTATNGTSSAIISTEDPQCTVTSNPVTKITTVGADCTANKYTKPADGSSC